MTRMIIAATVMLLAGCATADTELDTPRAAGDTIRFTAGRCFGACPAYSVQVTPDGSGLLEPDKFTAVPGPTRFTVTPAQYRQLRLALAPYRRPTWPIPRGCAAVSRGKAIPRRRAPTATLSRTTEKALRRMPRG